MLNKPFFHWNKPAFSRRLFCWGFKCEILQIHLENLALPPVIICQPSQHLLQHQQQLQEGFAVRQTGSYKCLWKWQPLIGCCDVSCYIELDNIFFLKEEQRTALEPFPIAPNEKEVLCCYLLAQMAAKRSDWPLLNMRDRGFLQSPSKLVFF